MSDLRKAAEMALKALDDLTFGRVSKFPDARKALRQALAQPEQESVTLLPDGSAFGVMSFPLPDSHWLYAEREYRDGEHEPIELGKPILTHELRDAVVSAVRYAIRGATNCGKEMDFDPDALVQNAVYALCGPYTRHVDAVNISQERVDETVKGEHKPYGYVWTSLRDGMEVRFSRMPPNKFYNPQDTKPVYTAPPKREWVGLTDEDIANADCVSLDYNLNGEYGVVESTVLEFARAIEAKLKEKNI